MTAVALWAFAAGILTAGTGLWAWARWGAIEEETEREPTVIGSHVDPPKLLPAVVPLMRPTPNDLPYYLRRNERPQIGRPLPLLKPLKLD